jgi:hypothetical protein
VAIITSTFRSRKRKTPKIAWALAHFKEAVNLSYLFKIIFNKIMLRWKNLRKELKAVK